MNSRLTAAVISLLSFLYFMPTLCAQTLILEDFEGKNLQHSENADDLSYVSEKGHAFGVWNKDPADKTQGCLLQLIANPDGSTGTIVELDYDVDSPYPAYNGFYLKLNGADFTGYDTLNLSLRGDADKGFTQQIKVELKGAHKKHQKIMKDRGLDDDPYLPSHTSSAMIEDVGDQWQVISIPLKKFHRIQDWSDMHEFVIVFEDVRSNPKAGVLYLDEIVLSGEDVDKNESVHGS